MNSRDARHLIITGVVQGVGFRYHMTVVARRLQVTGWVRNCGDGNVEAAIAGDQVALAELINWASHGPSAAFVEQVVLEQIEHPPTFNGFHTRQDK